jgi:protein tyrosine/serine phosphatase
MRVNSFSMIVGAPGLSNFGLVDSRVYRSADPGEIGYHAARSMGIRTVVNLEDDSHADLATEAGLSELHFPLSYLKIPVQKLLAVTTALIDPVNAPSLVHCREGQDRTGLVCWCYRIQYCKWTEEEAWEEAYRYGYHKELLFLTESAGDFAGWLRNMRDAKG